MHPHNVIELNKKLQKLDWYYELFENTFDNTSDEKHVCDFYFQFENKYKCNL